MQNEITITVFGRASNNIIFSKKFSPNELIDITLIEYLRNNQLPIASSCNFNGVCKKCVFNQTILSCKIKLKDLKEDLEMNFDYL